MTIEGTYSTEDLSKVASSVMLTGMAVAMVDAGIISTAIEATALAKEIANASKKYPNNEIIQSLFSEEAIEQAQKNKTQPTALKVEPKDMQPDTAVATAITAINDALAVLGGKASPEDIEQFKGFIYSCADAVANAAGSGLFGSGAKVSDKEAVALTQIKAALAI
ncbi:MAG: hypothetical protein N5P05_003896 [Chroococcopsis gigantea SAG 12.99]|jgi:hypothetical protein|nr:hypothetical protein [Chlorogloea purpurea SAG 13.99]MDV3002290.1 hypothetical protein [Chroococcopsis gigantea SAG 12.99]